MNQNNTNSDDLDPEIEDGALDEDMLEDDDEFEADDELEEDDEIEDGDEPEDDDDQTDDIDRYLDEYRKTLSAFAGFAAKNPEMVSELRRVLKISANLTFSNRPGLAEGVQEAAKDIDSFLKQVEVGEVDPENFITEEKDKPTPSPKND